VSALSESRLSEELTRAMKARDMSRVYVLRGLLTAAKNLKVEKRGEAPTETELVQLVRREIRKREEAEGFARQAGRADAISQNQAERAILEAFVPAQIDPTTLEAAIREIAARPEQRSIGAVMGALRERFAGRFDGRQASEIARRVLAEPSAV
jgi:uncharacterized protein YqeY